MSCLKIVDRWHHFSSLDLKDCVNTRSRCISPFTLTMFPNFLIPQFSVEGLDWNYFNMFEGWFWTYGNAMYVLVSIKLRFFQTIFYLFTNQTMCSHFCLLKLHFKFRAPFAAPKGYYCHRNGPQKALKHNWKIKISKYCLHFFLKLYGIESV